MGLTGYKLAVVMDEDDFIFLIERSVKAAKRERAIDRVDSSGIGEFIDLVAAVVFEEIRKDRASAVVIKGHAEGECYLISNKEQLIDFIKELGMLEEIIGGE
jgi:hypothetical protein